MQGIRETDVNDWTPEIKAEALRVLNLHKYSDNLFEPPIDRGQDGKFGMLMMPGNNGGTNWEGGAFDPETKIAYVFSSTEFNRRSLVNDPARSNMNYIDGGGGGGRGGRGAGRGEGGAEDAGPAAAAAGGAGPAGGRGRAGGAADAAPPLNAFGLPLVKPPYGRVTAINMNTGDHVWMAASAALPNHHNHKMLQGVRFPNGLRAHGIRSPNVSVGRRAGPLDT